MMRNEVVELGQKFSLLERLQLKLTIQAHLRHQEGKQLWVLSGMEK
ncbi:hypothetical protein SAMN05444422_10824 [Halobiforma haloterrestris]|uniref:Uncharacterized protein n=1 Tax=Natronobacterium haloterrestre TaxID=148448 RepID=A0A1I1IX24_NATHA|nr:hypothetical protein SAMN05444422_10824 [Halobiforma haloterrestris]